MKRGLVLLLALCTLAAAMVPRERRAVNTDEGSTSSSKPTSHYCSPVTACKWIIYNESGREEQIIDNSYCTCRPGTICAFFADNSNVLSYVFRCKEPQPEEESTTTADDS